MYTMFPSPNNWVSRHTIFYLLPFEHADLFHFMCPWLPHHHSHLSPSVPMGRAVPGCAAAAAVAAADALAHRPPSWCLDMDVRWQTH